MLKKNLKSIKKVLEKQKYALVGNSSGVQVCRWTRNSLNKKGVCWKEKFYGIKSHRCCQFSPAVMWCQNQCLHCWRPIELNLGIKLKNIDEPKKILDEIIEARKKLLIGFKGNKNVSEKMFKEACNPTLFSFSLSGEPTLYPKLGEIIKEIRNRGCVSFLVTNGQKPKAIEKLKKQKALPTQLTISCNAPNKKLFKIWHNSKTKQVWKKFNKTLELMKKLKGKTRRVFRMTLVKVGKEKGKFKDLTNMSDENVLEYADLIRKTEPDFIHVKGFMSVGYSRERMGYDKMPWHHEVKGFVKKLIKSLGKGWKVLGEEERSVVVLIGKSKKGLKIDMGRV